MATAGWSSGLDGSHDFPVKRNCSIRTQILLTGLLLLLAVLGHDVRGGQGETNSLKRTMYRVQAGEPDSNGWCLAESTGGHFKIKLPSRFNDFEVSGSDENGKKQENYIVGTITKENTKYSATLAVRKPPIIKELFGNFLNDFKKKATLKYSNELKVLGHPALETEVGDNARAAVMRMIVVENGVYMLVAEFDSNRKEALKGQVKTFLESFELPSSGTTVR